MYRTTCDKCMAVIERECQPELCDKCKIPELSAWDDFPGDIYIYLPEEVHVWFQKYADELKRIPAKD